MIVIEAHRDLEGIEQILVIRHLKLDGPENPLTSALSRSNEII